LRARTLAELRSRFGARPREFSRSERRYLRPERPTWLNTWDPLALQVRQSGTLAREGQVVWGAIVQANSQLWKEGPEDLTGVMLVDVEGSLDDEAWVLTDLAHQLFEIGQSRGDPELGSTQERQAVREFLAEDLPPAPLRLGPGLAGERILELIPVLVCRRHLPDGLIVDPLLPLCVQENTRVVYPVPAAFWPDRVLYAWRALGRRPSPARSLPTKHLGLVAALLLVVSFVLYLVWADYDQAQRAEIRQRAAQAVQRARTKAKRDALLKTQTLAANLIRLQQAAPADRPAAVARWRDEQGRAPGSRLAVFALASTWPDSERVTKELLESLELSPILPAELLECLELPQLKLTWRRALLADLAGRQALRPDLAIRLTKTPETPELDRLECALGFGQGGPPDLARLLEKRSARWLESEAGRTLLKRVADRGPAILSQLAQGVDLRIRREVAEALATSPHADAEPLRERLRGDEDPEVRHALRPR
jgi:hypothetical protein